MDYRISCPSCLFKTIVAFMLVGAVTTACVHKKTPEPREHPKAPAVEADMAAAQDHYNQGLQFYADEQYAKAKKAWLNVIKLAPDSRLAARARTYIKKVDRILKTLTEIEKK